MTSRSAEARWPYASKIVLSTIAPSFSHTAPSLNSKSSGPPGRNFHTLTNETTSAKTRALDERAWRQGGPYPNVQVTANLRPCVVAWYNPLSISESGCSFSPIIIDWSWHDKSRHSPPGQNHVLVTFFEILLLVYCSTHAGWTYRAARRLCLASFELAWKQEFLLNGVWNVCTYTNGNK